ncbi:hypothetical protein TraAM80_04744 [Trypanosoma rangeli]|uniref:Uncharacterized protein n=1 Tax=Trypanosoma rangeli TaxID=5698 RepID=A0A3R7MG14_TRYRA|nr:uncharacterized protein TraAM80_04744 [Trypanosoma rangeli]RNF05172.1 hypothetical protein TraAM80_04744 [Trypanosoma rangeli]|eukprot:RNF05172.1 hypothetical protein TraAM80_04744 [Trypanosoma rangeli]
MHDSVPSERNPESAEKPKPQEPVATAASVTATATAVDSGVSPPTQSRTRRFVQFLWACYNYIDAPLEFAIQQSVELAQFVDAAQCTSFLSCQQQQVRWGLWEMLRDMQAREVSALELEKQQRLYGGLARTGAKRGLVSCAHPSRDTVGIAMGTNVCRSSGNHSRGVGSVAGSVWDGLSEADEDALRGALLARGRYHARVPRHASHCQRRSGCRKNSLVVSQGALQSAPAKPSQSCLRYALFTDPAMMGVVGKTPLPEVSGAVNALAAEPHDPAAVLGGVESLTPGCSLCIAQGLLQATWASLHLLQLVNVASIAHLCAAPLLLPSDVLSTTPREALCIGYHVAQHQLKLAVGFLFSIATSPVSSPHSTSVRQQEQTEGSMADEKKKHHADVIRVIKTLATHGLDVCVHLLAALRCLEPGNAYVVLLHAAVLAFCDRDGVSKAKQLLRVFITSVLVESGEKPLQGDCDAYEMWLRFESALGGEVAARPDSEREMSLLERVASGILFSVFLELLELEQLPPLITHGPYANKCDTTAKATAVSAAAICLRARDILDKVLQPRLVKLCDAADGAISTRGRQLQSLCWLLRGTLCHILNALSLAPSTATILSHTYNADAPLACTREAVNRSDAAQEFVGHPLVPAWIDQMLGELEGGAVRPGENRLPSMRADKNGGAATTQWRLRVDGDAAPTAAFDATEEEKEEREKRICDGADVGVLPPHERVTEVAPLPPPAMRLWFVLAQTLFRSTSADLVAAGSRDGEAAEENTDRDISEGAFATTPASQTGVAAGGHTKDAVSRASHKEAVATRRGLTVQRAAMEERENVKKVMEARRRTEQSPIGFWWRWHEAMTRYRLLSVTTDAAQASLLGRYCQLFVSTAGDGVPPTTFMRALMEAHPVVSSEGKAFAAAHFFLICRRRRGRRERSRKSCR